MKLNEGKQYLQISLTFQFDSIQLSRVPENPFKRCFPIQSRRHPQN